MAAGSVPNACSANRLISLNADAYFSLNKLHCYPLLISRHTIIYICIHILYCTYVHDNCENSQSL